jgi:hypothetical protein
MHFYHLLSEVAIILVDDYNRINEQVRTQMHACTHCSRHTRTHTHTHTPTHRGYTHTSRTQHTHMRTRTQAGTEAALEDLVRLGELQVLYKGGVLSHYLYHQGWHNGFVGFVVRRTGGPFVERGRMREEL